LPSPYRFILIPVVQLILDLSKAHPDRRIIVVIPELVEENGMNSSSTISVGGFWNGCYWPAAMNASSR
jgi:hypothetical protein